MALKVKRPKAIFRRETDTGIVIHTSRSSFTPSKMAKLFAPARKEKMQAERRSKSKGLS